jgi:hypothetical protein
MPVSRTQAVANALASTTNTPRYCAQWTRTMFGVPALGDFDGDGAADAEDMWRAAKIRNEGDYTVPAGVPVYWGGGSGDNGHIAVSLGNGMCRSTDAAGAGKVGTVPLDYPVRQWGMPYLGWSEDLYGYLIPDPEGDLLRARLAKLALARRRKAKWQRWIKKANANIARLKELAK